MKRFIKWFADKIFPTIPRCLCCGVEKGVVGYVCNDCGAQLAAIKAGKTTAKQYAAFAVYKYDSPAAGIVKGYKYGGKRYHSQYMAEQMALALAQAYNEIDCICHVPLHKKRRAGRGFDQAEVLAQRVSQITNIPFISALSRIKNTKTQTKLTEQQRADNMDGAFESVCGVQGNVVLIDDVLTTGATVAECAKVLQSAGAKNVYVLTFACA